MGYFVNIDTTTHVLLAVIAATLVIGLYLRPGPPLVHPFLLGKQSIPSHSRQVGESAVYLNALTAGNRAPVRPDKAVKTVWDVVRESHSTFGFGKAGTWVQGGESIKETVLALAAGLGSKIGHEGGLVGIVVEDPTGKSAGDHRSVWGTRLTKLEFFCRRLGGHNRSHHLKLYSVGDLTRQQPPL